MACAPICGRTDSSRSTGSDCSHAKRPVLPFGPPENSLSFRVRPLNRASTPGLLFMNHDRRSGGGRREGPEAVLSPPTTCRRQKEKRRKATTKPNRLPEEPHQPQVLVIDTHLTIDNPIVLKFNLGCHLVGATFGATVAPPLTVERRCKVD